MQPIQRTSCPDPHRSPAAYLAAMIDNRTKDRGLSTAGSGARSGEGFWRFGTGMQRPDASVLIWVERDADLAREPAVRRHRGMIVAAHGSGRGTTEASFIISYPVDTGDHAQHLPAVSGLLKAMGWSVLASPCRSTDGDDVNSAVLLSTAKFGPEQLLWLAESVSTAQDRSAPAHSRMPGPSYVTAAGDHRTREMRDQLDVWVNEGGGGDDAAS